MMFKTQLAILSTVCLFMSPTNVFADIEVSFKDGAPKDRFVINNTSECSVQDIVLTIDLKNSAGGLIFDTTEMGEGIEVFQPFEVTKGQITLNTAEKVSDGDTHLSLLIKTIKANDSVSFTIDVDDTLTESQYGNIRVTDAEIKQATATVKMKDKNAVTGEFDNAGKALITMSECTI